MTDPGRTELPLVLRYSLGLGILGVGSSTGGVLTVALLVLLNGALRRVGATLLLMAEIAGGYTVFAMVTGMVVSTVLQRRALEPLRHNRKPDATAAARIRALSLRMTVLCAALWCGGLLVLGVAGLSLLALPDALAGVVIGLLGGIATTAFAFLLVERAVRPVLPAALAVQPGRRGTVLARLTVTWALTGGVPLSYVILTLTYTRSAQQDRIRAAVFIAALSLVVGIAATTMLARAVSSPLRRLRTALERVARGDLNVTVEVNDSSEIGLLQTSVNDLVHGLREQQRMRDLFGRHVGDPVADHAMAVGASLTGDLVEVAALFVDVADSTALAYRLPTTEFVDKLNRLLGDVVTATDRNGGLVNKFEGDAALCVFGAPVPLDDPATAALRAARSIRDAVCAADELDVGIGVATGQVFAGQLGTSRRLEYTVIGDAVNEAARLTDLAKHVPGRVLASQTTIDAAAPGERDCWTVHRTVMLRGRTDAVATWTTDHSG